MARGGHLGGCTQGFERVTAQESGVRGVCLLGERASDFGNCAVGPTKDVRSGHLPVMSIVHDVRNGGVLVREVVRKMSMSRVPRMVLAGVEGQVPLMQGPPGRGLLGVGAAVDIRMGQACLESMRLM